MTSINQHHLKICNFDDLLKMKWNGNSSKKCCMLKEKHRTLYHVEILIISFHFTRGLSASYE